MAQQPKSYKKFVATAATATLVASALVPVASAASSSFTDVPASYTDAVDYLVSKGANGLSATQFGISKEITRGDAAVLLAGALGVLDANAPDSGFTDVPARATAAVNSLKAAGIINGKTATSFGFGDNLKRGEVALIIANGYGLKGDASKLAFTDVSERYASAVAALVEAKVTSGISATKFGTDNNIKRGDFAKFAFGLKDGVPEVVTTATKVESVSATNLKEIVVAFDGTVDAETAEDAANYSLKSGKAIESVVLSEDEKTVTVTVVDRLTNNKADAISVSNVKAGDKELNEKNVEFTAVDNKIPEVLEIKSLGIKAVKVTLSEPVENLGQTNFTLDGKAYFGNVVMGAGNKTVILTPYSSSALSVGDHKLTVSGVKDFAGFVSLNSTHDFTVVEDKEAPTVTESSATLETVTLTFSEDVDLDTVKASNVYWKSGDSKKEAYDFVRIADNKYKFLFKGDNTLPTGKVDIYVEGVKDYSDNQIAKDTKVTVTPEIDQTRPEVRKVTSVDENTIKVTFSKTVEKDSATKGNNYTVVNADGKVISVDEVTIDPKDSKSVIIDLYSKLSVGENTITVKNVKDATKLNNTMLDYTGKVVRGDKDAPEYEAVINADSKAKRVVLKFDKKMDVATLGDYSNYLVRINGTLQTLTENVASLSISHDATVVTFTFAETINGNTVEFDTGAATSTSGKVHVNELQVLGVKDVAGNLHSKFNGVDNIVTLSNGTTTLNLARIDSDYDVKYKAELVDRKTVKVKFSTVINSADSNAFTSTTHAIDSVQVNGTSTVTVKFKENINTDGKDLDLNVILSRLVDIADNKGTVTTPTPITIAADNLLDSVAPIVAATPVVDPNAETITLTFSENLTNGGNILQLLNSDFTVTRIADNTKLDIRDGYSVAVANNNQVVITLLDTDDRDAASAYKVSVDGAKYITDNNGEKKNAIANYTVTTATKIASNTTIGNNAGVVAALVKINAATATEADYVTAGYATVTAGNLVDVKATVAAAKVAAGADLTNAQIGVAVNDTLAVLAEAAKYAATATIAATVDADDDVTATVKNIGVNTPNAAVTTAVTAVDANDLLTLTAGVVTLTDQIAALDPVNTTTATLTFTKGNASKTIIVAVTITKQS